VSEQSRTSVDWEAVEREYRIGIRSLRDIGGEFGVTEAAIRKRAKRDEWERDLSAKVSAKADALVRKQEVRKLVRAECAITERELINTSAQMLADTSINQREDVRQLRDTIRALQNELDELNANKEETLSDRVRIAKAIAETTKIVIELERRILKLDDAPLESGQQVTRIELVALQ